MGGAHWCVSVALPGDLKYSQVKGTGLPNVSETQALRDLAVTRHGARHQPWVVLGTCGVLVFPMALGFEVV